MSDYLSWKEKMDLRRLLKTLHAVVDKYAADEASYHSPHAVSHFCHGFYHDYYEDILRHRTQELAAAIAAGEEVDGITVLASGELALSPILAEEMIRQAFEMILLIGIEHGRRGHSPTECKCIEDVGDGVEQLLHDGEWGHA